MGMIRNFVVNFAIIAAGSVVVLSCILLAWMLVGWIFAWGLAGGAGRTDAVYPAVYILLHAGIITAILLSVLIVGWELESRREMRDFKIRTGSNS